MGRDVVAGEVGHRDRGGELSLERLVQGLSETAAALSVAVAGLGSNGMSACGAEAACLVADVSACAVGGIVSAMAGSAMSPMPASAPGTRPSLPPPTSLHAAEKQREEGSMDRGEAEQ